MQRAPVRNAVFGDVPEDQRISLATLEAATEHRKRRVPGLIIVVEIDEQGKHPLAAGRYVLRMAWKTHVQEIVMRSELLSDLVVQDLAGVGVESRQWQLRERCDARAQEGDHHIDARETDLGGAVAAAFVRAQADLLPVENLRLLQVRLAEADQPIADRRGGKAVEHRYSACR